MKKVAKALITKLKSEKLVLDWKKRQTIETMLDELPRTYSPELYQRKCDVVYQHLFNAYSGQGASLYAAMDDFQRSCLWLCYLAR